MGTRALRCSKALPVAALSLIVLLGVLFLQPDLAHAQESGGEFVNGEIVVKLTPGTNVNVINTEYGTETKETFLSSARIYLLRVTDGEDAEAKAERMSEDDRLRPEPLRRFNYAEPNSITDAPEGGGRMRSFGDADPEPSPDSALYKTQYAVGALNMLDESCANGISRGAGTTVAVLDTGVQQNHPVLKDSLVTGYDFIEDESSPEDEGNGANDDGDTYVDESGNEVPLVDEGTGHGTHVSGIVHLVAPEAEIMPLRVLDSEGRGNVFVIAEAVQRAINGPDGDPATTEDGADVINMSLGSSRESNLLRDVTEDLGTDDDDDDDGPALILESVPAQGVVAVASAGNENTETEAYPAAEPGVMGVASVGEDGTKSGFSNYYGDIRVSAPGDDIYSTFPTDRYASWDGTSMAAPFVAGQAALIRSLDPAQNPSGMDSQTPVGIERIIFESGRALEEANKNQPYSGKLGRHADIGASLKSLRPDAATCSAGTEPPPPADTTPPDTSISSGPSGTTKNTTASFSFAATEPVSRFECSLNGSAFGSCASPKSYSGLASRAHALRVRAVDRAGNVDATTSSRAWTVDTIRPTVTSLSPAPNATTRDRTPTIAATLRDSQTNLGKGNITMYVDGRRITSFAYYSSTDRLMFTPSMAPGYHKVTLVARDAAGNSTTAGWGFRIVS